MKLLCIEDGVIVKNTIDDKCHVSRVSTNDAPRVIEGNTYTGKNLHLDRDGDMVWFIVEINHPKLAERFIPVMDETDDADQMDQIIETVERLESII